MLRFKLNRISKFCTRFFLLLLLATTVWESIVLVMPRSKAHPGTTIALDQVEYVADPGEFFLVNATIADVGDAPITDVYSYQVKIGFDKNVLTAITAVEGPYLKDYAEGWGTTTLFLVVKDNPNYILVECVLRRPAAEPIPGCPEPSGVLFTATFHVEAPGVSTLDVFGSIITTNDGSGNPAIPHYPPDEFTETDSSFRTNVPMAAFSFSPNTYGRPIVGENVSFDGSASFDPDGGIIASYIWNFSDGAPLGSGMIVKHIYHNASSLLHPYNVTLTVTDEEGLNTTTYKKSYNEQLQIKKHDIAITNLTRITIGDIFVHQDVEFNVTVMNNGSHPDTFNVTSFCDTRPFNTSRVDDLLPGQSKNITHVLKTFINQTTINPSEATAGAGWTLDSLNASVSDDKYTWSSTNQSTQSFRKYKVFDGTGWDGISKVEVGLEVHTDSLGDDMLSVQAYSGLEWTEEYFLTVNSTTDTLVWIDVKGNLTWLPKLLQPNKMAVKVKYIQVGPDPTPIYINWLPVRISPTNPVDLPQGSYALWANAFLVDPSTLGFRAGEEENLSNNVCFGEPVVLTIVPVHEVAVTEVSVSPTEVPFGGSSTIKVEVKNLGNLEEVIDVFVYFNGTAAGSQTDVNIVAGSTRTFTFSWYQAKNNTVEGIYNVTAQVPLIVNSTGYPLESNLTDNVATKMVLMRLLPVASFNFSPAKPDVGQVVAFVASNSYAPGVPGGSIQTYSWDFGGGSTGSGVTVSYTFTSPGSKSVKLTVTDDQNLTFIITKNVLVPKLISDITLSVSSLIVPLSLNTTISGGILPIRDNATVLIDYKPAEQTVWTRLKNATTDAEGKYSFVWAPREIGNFTLRALWNGDANTLGATSSSLNVTVKLQDTAVLNVVPSEYLVTVGDSLLIDVTVANNGTASETVNLSVYYNTTLLETKALTNFAANASKTVRFTLNTEDLAEGVYFIKAVSVALLGEKSTGDNSRTVAVLVQEEQEVPEEEQPLNIFMFSTIGLAVALVALLAYFFLKMRKT